MEDKIVLITKDAMCCSYLPVYGNKYWRERTPNLDELAEQGTVFTRCYSSAPSTAMSFLGMFTGKYPYQLEIHDYSPLKEEFRDNLFQHFETLGYASHIIWDAKWDGLAKPYSNCYGNAVFHSLEDLGEPVGPAFPREQPLAVDHGLSKTTINRIIDEIQQIDEEKLFLWVHLPHVLKGSVAYGSDIDVFDEFVGVVRGLFSDRSIFISADHGNMNGSHGLVQYGFHLYEPAIRIPLITPRIDDFEQCNDLCSNIDIAELLLNNSITRREYVVADSAYYKQQHRKLGIIHGQFKYIYNKSNDTEEMYDLAFDESESINLINEKVYDRDRHCQSSLRELLPYPDWERLREEIAFARSIKAEIWRSETKLESYYWKTRHVVGAALDSTIMISRQIRSKLHK